jgi:hypothetical protein
MRTQPGTSTAINISHSKQWRRDHPFGFFAKPVRTQQNILDLKKWECGVPGKDKTLWEGGLLKLEVTFPDGKFFPSVQDLWHIEAERVCSISLDMRKGPGSIRTGARQAL